MSVIGYPKRNKLIQTICPAPKRYFQHLIEKYDLKTGLDIGCGNYSLLTSVKSSGFKSVGIDISDESIEISKANNVHDSYIKGDFRDQNFNEKFDVVVLSHVIEHFQRDEGMEVLRKVESLAKRLIYIETPHGFLEQSDLEGNSFQRHLSGWFPHDFECRGYTVFGSGIKGLTGPVGKPRLFPLMTTRNINRAFQWFLFRRAYLASTIAAIKYFDENGNIVSV